MSHWRELAALHRGRHERDAVHERAGRDDHPAGVLGEMARQPLRLGGQPREPRPAAGPPPFAQRRVDVAVDVARRPALAAARDALDLARRQAERLAELADRAAGAVGREGRDERRALAAVDLVDARDQHLADVAREVEVDVGQRRELLVEEAPEQELVGDRVDVAEAREVADDRRDARAAPAAGRQQRARIGPRRPAPAPAHLHGDLPRELEDLAVQDEEAREAERVDDAQLLLQADLRLRAVRGSRADSAPRSARGRSRRARGRRRRPPRPGSGSRGRSVRSNVSSSARRSVSATASGWSEKRAAIAAGRRQHVRVVAAAQRLGGVERRVLADRDEGVLQQRALGGVRVDVARGDGRDAEPLGEPRQPAVQRAVVAGERALQLDAQVVAAEARRAGGAASARRGRRWSRSR